MADKLFIRQGLLMQVSIDLERVLTYLERKTGDRWICLFRAHYLSRGIDVKQEHNRLVDVTSYDDVTDLLLASDMLLTDYSSAAMDFIIRDLPALFYIADWEDYEADRGVYFDIHEAPLMKASNQEELEALIDELTPEKVCANCTAIKKYFGYYETGHATDSACDYIIERLGSVKIMPD